jgi:hypothetical protein
MVWDKDMVNYEKTDKSKQRERLCDAYFLKEERSGEGVKIGEWE